MVYAKSIRMAFDISVKAFTSPRKFPRRVGHASAPIVTTYLPIHYIRGMIKDSVNLMVQDQPYVNNKTGLGSNLPIS